MKICQPKSDEDSAHLQAYRFNREGAGFRNTISRCDSLVHSLIGYKLRVWIAIDVKQWGFSDIYKMSIFMRGALFIFYYYTHTHTHTHSTAGSVLLPFLSRRPHYLLRTTQTPQADPTKKRKLKKEFPHCGKNS
jgi:hypothetical protein